MAPDPALDGMPVPEVAVIIPAYRTEAYVADTVRSVQAQSLTSWECIVVDDGSPDDLAARVAELATADQRIRLVRQQNLGLCEARNTGITQISDGVRYVAFLDSDDLWCADALERLVEALDADPAAVGAYGYAELVDESGRPVHPGKHVDEQRKRRRLVGYLERPVGEHEPLGFDELIVRNPIWPPAVALHRREVVEAVGTFDPALKQCEDQDFMIRMGRHGHYRPLSRQVAWYRQHGGQVTKRRAEFRLSYDMVRYKTWESEDNTPEQRQQAARAWRVAQLREVAFCTVRLGSAVLARQWRDARRLTRGWAVLVLQLARARPPVARINHVRWAGRDI